MLVNKKGVVIVFARAHVRRQLNRGRAQNSSPWYWKNPCWLTQKLDGAPRRGPGDCCKFSAIRARSAISLCSPATCIISYVYDIRIRHRERGPHIVADHQCKRLEKNAFRIPARLVRPVLNRWLYAALVTTNWLTIATGRMQIPRAKSSDQANVGERSGTRPPGSVWCAMTSRGPPVDVRQTGCAGYGSHNSRATQRQK